MKFSQIARYALFILALLVLTALVFAAVRLLRQPGVTAFWSYDTGEVFQILTSADQPQSLEVGDRILTIDGIPPWQALGLAGKKAGDRVTLQVSRDGSTFETVVELPPAGWRVLWSRLVPVIIALTFWFFGGLILSYARYEPATGWVSLSLLLIALTLGLGGISAIVKTVVPWLFVTVRLIVGPVTLVAQYEFPTESETRIRKPFGWILSTATFLLLVFTFAQSNPAASIVSTTGYLWLGGNILVTLWVLVRKYRKTKSAVVRRKIGLINLSFGISLLLFVSVTLLPELLFSRPILPYEISLLSLLLIPAGYALAVFRNDLIQMERIINRSAAFMLVLILLVAFYVLAYFILVQILPVETENALAWGLLITLPLAFVFSPLFNLASNWVNRILYGGWYDQFSVVQDTTRSLSRVENDLEMLADTLCSSLSTSMKLEYVHLLLNSGLLVLHKWVDGEIQVRKSRLNSSLFQEIEARMADRRSLNAAAFRSELVDLEFPDDEVYLLMGDHASMVYTLGERDKVLGFLILGNKFGDEPFVRPDLEIMDVIIQQASAAIQNIRNLQRIEKVHHRLIQAREEERKMIAHDLHDRTIQSLIGVNYSLKAVGEEMVGTDTGRILDVQLRIRETIEDLRRICSDLRPVTLDLFGLLPAIRAKIDEIEPEIDFSIELLSGGDDRLKVPDPAALAVYRVFQEALVNIRKHAGASRAQVMLTFDETEISCEIWDNGRGFEVPGDLQLLSISQHFGLLGMQEMVQAVSGKLEISSQPGEGCTVSVVIPLVNDQQILEGGT